MKIYRTQEDQLVSPTDGSVTIKDFSSSLYNTRWAIRIRGEWYISLQALSTVRAAEMSGRATLVWRVVKKGTMEVSQTCAFFVLPPTITYPMSSTVLCLKAKLATSHSFTGKRLSSGYSK